MDRDHSGMAANVRSTGVPQTGQKEWILSLPLSPAMRQSVAMPVIVTSARDGNVR